MNRITIAHTVLSALKVMVILENGLAAPSVSTICTVIMSLFTWVLLQCQEHIRNTRVLCTTAVYIYTEHDAGKVM